MLWTLGKCWVFLMQLRSMCAAAEMPCPGRVRSCSGQSCAQDRWLCTVAAPEPWVVAGLCKKLLWAELCLEQVALHLGCPVALCCGCAWGRGLCLGQVAMHRGCPGALGRGCVMAHQSFLMWR